MRNRAIAIALILPMVLGLAGGCAGKKQRAAVCSGMLQVGVSSKAFIDVWGPPTRTSVTTGEQIIEAGWSAGGGNKAFAARGGFFKGKRTYEVWTYETRKVVLIFNLDKKKSLAAWQTDSTVQELAAGCRN